MDLDKSSLDFVWGMHLHLLRHLDMGVAIDWPSTAKFGPFTTKDLFSCSVLPSIKIAFDISLTGVKSLAKTAFFQLPLESLKILELYRRKAFRPAKWLIKNRLIVIYNRIYGQDYIFLLYEPSLWWRFNLKYANQPKFYSLVSAAVLNTISKHHQ